MNKLRLAAPVALALACAVLGAPVHAQDRKTVVAEPVAILPGFNQWTETVVVPVPETPVNPLALQLLQLISAAPASNAPAVYHPKPVILGQPELPLLGDAGASARGWGPSLNYQGMHVKMVLLDERGVARRVQPVNAPLRAGQRFKVRVTPTFDAVAGIDGLAGDTWSLRRAAQIYPPQGTSVQIRAGETVDLPLGATEYFVMPVNAAPMVLSVRHPRASGTAASDQPAYRADGARGSNYLQLVPQGQWPAIEQQVGAAAR
jgi:hypothetical protein